jgi:putative ABC transport system permease protein
VCSKVLSLFLKTEKAIFMQMYIRLFIESFKVAIASLSANKLRTFLSLLGISFGIFAIIGVYSIVDSLENKIREDVQSLGDNVIYVQKWPWGGGGDEYPWWKFLSRPEPDYEDYLAVKDKIESASAICFAYGMSKTMKYSSNSVENVTYMGVSEDYLNIWDLEIANGRFLSKQEFATGKPFVVLGSEVAEGLFENKDPIGRDVKINGKKLVVIGVFKQMGANLIGDDPDVRAIVPAKFMMKSINPKSVNNNVLMVKAKEGTELIELIDEITGKMRAFHRLKPKADDDFSVNDISVMASGLDAIFGVVGIAGTFIGIFSVLVGGFGIANIMIVSVKERTGQIGIQKSLGAKNYFILLQFIFESIVLSLFGGLVGLIMVFAMIEVVAKVADFDFFLSFWNITLGIGLSVLIGILSGAIPAFQASRMDPVEAIRANG